MAAPTVDLTSFTPEQKAAFYNAANLAPTPVSTVDNNPTISASSLGASAPLSVPNYSAPAVPAPAPASALTSSLAMGVTDAQNALNQNKADLQAAYDQQAQQTQRTQQLEQQYGVPGLSARLNELNALDVGYQSDLANIQSQDLQGTLAQQGTATSEVGRQINLKDLNYNSVIAQQNVNIKRATNNAVIATLTGQLANAQANIQRALDLEFKPLQSKIDYLQAFLKLNADNLSSKEQQQLQYKITQETRSYEEQKTARENTYNLTTQAIKDATGAGITIPNDVVTKAFAAKDPQTAAALLAPYLGAKVKDLQYVSATQYQPGGYFDKNTGKFVQTSAAGGGTGGGARGTVNGVYTPGTDKVVDSWAQRIFDGSAKITDIPASEKGLRDAVTVALTQSGNTLTGKPTVTELGQAALQSAKDLLAKMDKGDYLGAVGGTRVISPTRFIPGTAQANFVNDFNTLKSQLSLEGVKYLKGQGQVSDAERALLAQAVTKLNTSQSPSEFKQTLQGIVDRLSGAKASSAPQGFTTIAPDGTQVIITD